MDALVNYGALGIFVLAFLSGLIFSKQTVDRLIRERDKSERQRDELISDVITKVTPALERSIEAIKNRDTLDRTIQELLTDIRRLLENRT